MYRRQASAASSSGGADAGPQSEASEDGFSVMSPTVSGHGITSLSRAKSVSSVSSVNSTSSMEAVPFRAAPLGNTRVGFGGYSRGTGRTRRTAARLPAQSGVTQHHDTAESQQDDATYGDDNAHTSALSDANVLESPASQASRGSHLSALDIATSTAGPSTPLGRHRVLPKGPSDDWLYRNAPGLGSGNFRTSKQPHTVGASATQKGVRTGLRGVFDLDNDDDDDEEGGSGAGDGVQGVTAVHRVPKSSIRSKLVKRAGKLGLKPLTSVPVSMAPAGVSKSTSPQTDGLVIQTDVHGKHSDFALGDNESPSSRMSASGQGRLPKSASVGPASTSASGLTSTLMGRTASPLDAESSRRTSSVTNAPLVVPKNPPGPPGSGPPPSPGLKGMVAYPFSDPAAGIKGHEVSAQRLANKPLEEADTSPSRPQDNSQPSLLVTQHPIPHRTSSSSNLVSGAPNAGDRSSNSTMGNLPARGADSPSTPPLTPAQQVQLDARAGLAILPSEPSGASPGPNPDSTDDLRQDGLASPQMPRRPASMGLPQPPPPETGRSPYQRYSGSTPVARSKNNGGAIASGADLGTQKRPGFIRAITGESAKSGRTSNRSRQSILSAKDGAKGYSSKQSSSSSSPSESTFPMAQVRTNALPVDASARQQSDHPPPMSRPPQSAVSEEERGDLTASHRPVAFPLQSLPGLSSSDDSPVGHKIHSGDVNSLTTPSALPSVAISVSSSAGTSSIEAKSPSAKPGDLNVLASATHRLSTGSPDDANPDRQADILKPVSIAASAASPNTVSAIDGGSRLSFDGPRDRLSSPQTVRATGPSAGSLVEAGPIAGHARGHSAGNRSGRTRNDFHFGELLGEGSYSTVIEAWDLVPLRESGQLKAEQPGRAGIRNNALAAFAGKTSSSSRRAGGCPKELEGAKVYAIKVLDKVHILKEKKQKYVGVEKEALSILTRQPGVVSLYWTFQDSESLYFVLELAPNGELLSFVKKLGSFNEECTRFYGAQLLDTIDGMHKLGVLHRDVKPENVLLDKDMRIRIADFGSAKILASRGDSSLAQQTQHQSTSDTVANGAAAASGNGGKAVPKPRPSSFVGTAEYVSPELLTDKQVSEASDLWAFGCILYQMLSGRPPFKGASEYQTFQKIMRRDLTFQAGFPDVARSLIEKLLVLDPAQRLSPSQVRSHAFFEGFDWSAVWTMPAPQLEAGLYKRPPEPQSVASEQSSLLSSFRDEDDGDGIESELDNDDGETEGDDGVSMQNSVGDGTSRHVDTARSGQHASSWLAQRGDDADDDESSMSESASSPALRKRGFSTGASAAERMLSHMSNPARRGSNSILGRVAAGLTGGSGVERGAPANSGGRTQNDEQSVGLERPQHLREHSYQQMSSHGNSHAHGPLAISWAALLLPQESLLYACPVLHKTTGALLRNANKKRQLLLTDFPRLLCVKETNDQLKVKSEIILGVPRDVGNTFETVGHGNALQVAPNTEAAPSPTAESRLGHDATRMQRQSSAGPVFTSPTPSSGSRDLSNSVERISLGEASAAQQHERGNGRGGGSRLSSTLSPPGAPSVGGGMPTAALADAVHVSPNVMTSIEARSNRSFIVHTPARSYVYEDPTGDATHWIKSISVAARRFGVSPTMTTTTAAAA